MQGRAITCCDRKAQRLDRLNEHELVRDIPGSPPPDSASRDGWRRKTMGAAGFHQLGSEFADARIAHVREKLARGETVYLAGLGAARHA